MPAIFLMRSGLGGARLTPWPPHEPLVNQDWLAAGMTRKRREGEGAYPAWNGSVDVFRCVSCDFTFLRFLELLLRFMSMDGYHGQRHRRSRT